MARPLQSVDAMYTSRNGGLVEGAPRPFVGGRGVRDARGKAIDDSALLGDQNANDILEISRGVDKWLWMVEAHLHREG